MEKKFVPLNENLASDADPRKIKTWNEIIKKNDAMLNLEDFNGKEKTPILNQLKNSEKELQSRLRNRKAVKEKDLKNTKPKCDFLDNYKECVKLRKTPAEMRKNAKEREELIQKKEESDKCYLDVFNEHFSTEKTSEEKIIKLDSPTFIESTKPRKHSEFSKSVTFLPSKKILDIKKPRSYIFINETNVSSNSSLPCDIYNPRLLQKQFEEDYQNFEVVDRDGKLMVRIENDVLGDKNFQCLFYHHSDHTVIAKESKFFEIPSTIALGFTPLTIFGTERIDKESIAKNRNIFMACIFVAFGYVFVTPETDWDEDVVDEIISDGTDLWEKSLEYQSKSHINRFNIIPYLNVEEKTLIVGVDSPTFEGELNNDERNAENILEALTQFFKNHRYCLFFCKDLYLLIWRRCNNYNIFDPNGRATNCSSDIEHGQPALITVKHIDYVAHVILNLSNLSKTDYFQISDIILEEFGPEIDIDMLLVKKPKEKKKTFVTVNRFFGIIRGSIGLAPPEDDYNNPSMLVSCFAILYAEIDPPLFWKSNVIDGLIKFSVKAYVRLVKEKKISDFSVRDIPNVLNFGNFRAELKTIAFRSSGQIRECKSYKTSTLTFAIKAFFEADQSGILCLNNTALGIWRDGLLFYVFDTFERGKVGEFVDEDDDEEDGAGCLQIHSTLDSMCRALFRNSMDIAPDGNFFLHAIRITKITTESVFEKETNEKTFNGLMLKFPISCSRSLEKRECGAFQTTMGPSNFPRKCLSVLSLTPCKRTCSESEVYEKEKRDKRKKRKEMELKVSSESLESLESYEKLPEFDDIDLVDETLEELFNAVIDQAICREENNSKGVGKSKKILLKSDLKQLKYLQKLLKQGQDYDNFYESFKTKPTIIESPNLSEELLEATNFTQFPDGSWIIRGTQVLVEDSLEFGLLSGLLALVMATKYDVKTWTQELIDYVINNLGSFKDSLGVTESLVTFFDSRDFNVQIGSQIFHIELGTVFTGRISKLHAILIKLLEENDKLIIIMRNFACSLVKTKNFFYVFMGHKLNIVGIRTEDGDKSCMIRFNSINDTLRKIKLNASRGQNDNKYVKIITVSIKEEKENNLNRFLNMSESRENKLYQQETANLTKLKKTLAGKQAFINSEIANEELRIKNFSKQISGRKQTASSKSEESLKNQNLNADLNEEMKENESSFDENDQNSKKLSENSINSNQNSDSLNSIQNKTAPEKSEMPEVGYCLRETDCLFKIQGTLALKNRGLESRTTIKSCHFATIYALLSAVHYPIYQWSSQRVDEVIKNAQELYLKCKNPAMCCLRIIKNLKIDGYIYKIIVKRFEINEEKGPKQIQAAIEMLIRTRKYFIIQFKNVSFAVFKDSYFHLFDSYSSLDVLSKSKTSLDKECPEKDQIWPDKNTASWILLGNITEMLEYIRPRTVDLEFKLYIIDIVSYRKVPKISLIGELLLKSSENKLIEEIAKPLPPESADWLQMNAGLIPWSRRISVNSLNQKRGLSMSKWNQFDIEISGELFSLWGDLHPLASVFKESRGKQYLAVNVIACCLVKLYPVEEWNKDILNSTVIYGENYLKMSMANIQTKDYELSLEDLSSEYMLNNDIKFKINFKYILYGELYNLKEQKPNLSSALTYFFKHYHHGIIQAMNKSLAFGKTDSGLYFMFDCQSAGHPLFEENQGASYVLLCTSLEKLLYCITVTLNIPYYNMEFYLHAISVKINLNNSKPNDS